MELLKFSRRESLRLLAVGTVAVLGVRGLEPDKKVLAAVLPDSSGFEFKLGFGVIKGLIPLEVGDPMDNETYNEKGDSLQRTTGSRPDDKGGLLVWRKSDNWTAYTNGHETWVNGPNGLQKRLNTERFPWENDPVVAVEKLPAYNFPPTPAGGDTQEASVQSGQSLVNSNWCQNIAGAAMRQVRGIYVGTELRGSDVVIKVHFGNPNEVSEFPISPRPDNKLVLTSNRGTIMNVMLESDDPVQVVAAVPFYFWEGGPIVAQAAMPGRTFDNGQKIRLQTWK